MENLKQENEMKMKMFELAMDNGEIDHLITNPVERLKTQLWRLAEEALKMKSTGNTELQELQSIIGMVHTLVTEARTSELNDHLKNALPEYYHS